MRLIIVSLLALLFPLGAAAQTGARVVGTVTDETGGMLPGVTVELRTPAGMSVATTVTDETGRYSLPSIPAGRYQLQFTLVNFAPITHADLVVAGADITNNETMHLTLKIGRAHV